MSAFATSIYCNYVFFLVSHVFFSCQTTEFESFNNTVLVLHLKATLQLILMPHWLTIMKMELLTL